MSSSNNSRLTMAVVFGLIIAVVVLVGYPALQSALRRAHISEVASNGRSLKLVMDSFAMDNDGTYPSQDSSAFYGTPDVINSNAALQQLHASGNTNSEKKFWVKGAAVCTETKPDDVTTSNGRFDSTATLQAGDNGWSLYPDRTNTENADHPILVTAFLPGAEDLDPIALNGTAIVYHIGGHGSIVNTDGSAPGKALDTGRGTPLQAKTTAILNDLPEDFPFPLHPIPAMP
jgi:type II secretory pathway pseudopilin PulG